MITPEQHREIEARLERNRKAQRRWCVVCGKPIDGNVSIASADLSKYRHVRCNGIALVGPKDIVGVEDEIRDLHKPIIEHCRYMGWIYFYSNPRRKTGRRVGENDFHILADCSRVFHIECKSRGQELSPAQAVLQRTALYLGHTIHVVYTMDQFYELVK